MTPNVVRFSLEIRNIDEICNFNSTSDLLAEIEVQNSMPNSIYCSFLAFYDLCIGNDRRIYYYITRAIM